MACETAITEGAAKLLYERLLATQGVDGCTLDEVSTERTRMTVLWKTHATALPVAEIVHRDCAASDAVVGPSLAIRVPEALRAACSATVPAAVAVVQHESFDVPATRATPGVWRPVAMGAAGLAALVFIVLLELRRRRIAAPPPP